MAELDRDIEEIEPATMDGDDESDEPLDTIDGAATWGQVVRGSLDQAAVAVI